MTQSSYTDNRQKLTQLMQKVGITNLKELSHRSGISTWQLIRIEYGLMPKTSLGILLKLAETLQISLNELLNQFCPPDILSSTREKSSTEKNYELETLKQEYQRLQTEAAQEKLTLQQQYQNLQAEREKEKANLQQEYQRLQAEIEQQKETLLQEFQNSSLQQLESWLIQWPTAAVVAQKNPNLPAIKLLPLIKPVAGLLKQWGVEAIASVGEEIPYDPQSHQLLEGHAEPGEPVRVRYVGYRQGDKLLYRAKVSPMSLIKPSEASQPPQKATYIKSEETVFDPPLKENPHQNNQ